MKAEDAREAIRERARTRFWGEITDRIRKAASDGKNIISVNFSSDLEKRTILEIAKTNGYEAKVVDAGEAFRGGRLDRIDISW